jgi:hypothetical protein
MRKTLTAAFTAAVLGAMPFAGTAAAAAAPTPEEPLHGVQLVDPTGDVWKDATTTTTSRPSADVIGARVFHGVHNLHVTMAFTDLKRLNPQTYTVLVKSGAANRIIKLKAMPGKWQGYVVLKTLDGDRLAFPGLTRTIDYADNVVKMSIPRALLHNPNGVRVQLSNTMFGAGGSTFTDHPFGTTAVPGPTDLTPRLIQYPAS